MVSFCRKGYLTNDFLSYFNKTMKNKISLFIIIVLSSIFGLLASGKIAKADADCGGSSFLNGNGCSGYLDGTRQWSTDCLSCDHDSCNNCMCVGCGTATGGYYASAPSSNLCNDDSSLSGSVTSSGGSWVWTCKINHIEGFTKSCSAGKQCSYISAANFTGVPCAADGTMTTTNVTVSYLNQETCPANEPTTQLCGLCHASSTTAIYKNELAIQTAPLADICDKGLLQAVSYHSPYDVYWNWTCKFITGAPSPVCKALNSFLDIELRIQDGASAIKVGVEELTNNSPLKIWKGTRFYSVGLMPDTETAHPWATDARIYANGSPKIIVKIPEPFSCSGSIPGGSTMCAGDDTGLIANGAWHNVGVAPASCTNTAAAKCEYYTPVCTCTGTNFFSSSCTWDDNCGNVDVCTGTLPAQIKTVIANHETNMSCQMRCAMNFPGSNCTSVGINMPWPDNGLAINMMIGSTFAANCGTVMNIGRQTECACCSGSCVPCP
jgi:hypothetical protein